MSTWIIQSCFVRAEIQSLGAMLGPAWFSIGNAEIQPFAIAPWSEDSGSEYEALPGIVQRLRGEWICVPYGIQRGDLDALPLEWQPRGTTAVELDASPHGLSSNSHWQLSELSDDQIELVLEYPSSHPVKSVRRSIRASQARPELEMKLRIEARAPCDLPIGLHPTFRLPTVPRRASLQLGPRARAWTSPIPLEPQIARFQSDIRDVPLDRIPLGGSTEDITRLPLPYAAEETVLTRGHSGRAILTNLDERYAVTLSWDPDIFPACQLWLSNRGREIYPWNGRFLALGIEPICAAFDLGTAVSQNKSNPLWRAGSPCTVSLSQAQPFETTYSIAVGAVTSGNY